MKNRPIQPLLAAIASGVLLASAGCKPTAVESAPHEPNYLYARAIEIKEDVVLEQPLNDSQELLKEWFGTLDEPKLPPLFAEDDYKELLSTANLEIAAGPPAATVEPGEKGLYRQLCASCHGESGQGRGPVAASQNPYPREFRHGIFKYKSTARKNKPVKADIARALRKGLSGSQMPLFNKLPDAKINALVDYVVFLSIRGEFERKILFNAATELDLDKDRVFNVSLKGSNESEPKKQFDGQIESAAEILTAIADAWVESNDGVEEFELPSFPIVGSETTDNKAALEESIAKGRKLFLSEEAACAKCHGESARGDGKQLPDYDDWTKDWTSKIDISPTKLDSLMPLMALGGMKPQPLKPRNIVEGKFRGGREPMDIYRRIRYGIVGSPMPAAAIIKSSDDKGINEVDIWHLVNYVLSIAEPESTIAAN
ncbi:MAG: cytochrome c [Planctomycetota bacterium]|nr:cytochrome c [Planctomycetota bacterium]